MCRNINLYCVLFILNALNESHDLPRYVSNRIEGSVIIVADIVYFPDVVLIILIWGWWGNSSGRRIVVFCNAGSIIFQNGGNQWHLEKSLQPLSPVVNPQLHSFRVLFKPIYQVSYNIPSVSGYHIARVIIEEINSSLKLFSSEVVFYLSPTLHFVLLNQKSTL